MKKWMWISVCVVGGLILSTGIGLLVLLEWINQNDKREFWSTYGSK